MYIFSTLTSVKSMFRQQYVKWDQTRLNYGFKSIFWALWPALNLCSDNSTLSEIKNVNIMDLKVYF